MEANPGNSCAGLEINKVTTLFPVAHTMDMQVKLQDRLGKLPPVERTVADRTLDVIYWRHCIHSECDELLEWFLEADPNFVEIEMEAIDILHFVYNVGIAFDISPEITQGIVGGYIKEEHPIVRETTVQLAQHMICNLSASLTNLIDLLPWKSWKNYDNYEFDTTKIILAYGSVVKANLQLAGCLGMDMQRIVDVYAAKNLENHARQDRGY